MTSPSAYIPIDRRHALAAGHELPDRAGGSALFADISGFTPLTEALTRAFGHARGAEELVAHLDRIYDTLIAQIDLYGGSVIGFSGDAITCWFDGDTAARAAAAAFAMQQALRQFAAVEIPQHGAVAITVKIAISVGTIRRFLVGDPAIQLIDLLAGTTIDRLGEIEQIAQPGEVVTDEHTWQALATIAQLHEWRSHDAVRYAVIRRLSADIPAKPWPALAPDALDEAQMRAWVLAPVYERLKHQQGKFVAELRPATVLFLNFSGIEYDHDHSAGDKLDTFVRRVQQILAHYEGTLVAITFGDKGSYFEAAFGAPIAHDDDSARALSAAIEMERLSSELPFITQIKIGISRGRMRTGAYGSADRLTYGVQGNEVNLAARLMQLAAPQQILVSERVATDVAAHYRFTPLGAVQIKGKQDPVNVFEMVRKEERRSVPSVLTALIGRAAERALLSSQLQALRNQNSSVALLEGEAGIGKSRLVEALRQEAQALAVTALVGAGDATDRSTPYHAWRPVFAQIFQLDTLPEDKGARRRHVLAELERYVEPELLRFGPLLHAVLALDFPENELTQQMSGQVRADNAHLLLTRILQHFATAAPLLLLLEDAHWFDTSSWALARDVVRNVHPLMLVIATRTLSEPLQPDYVELRHAQNAQHIPLMPLPAADIEALIRLRLGVTTVPKQVAELIRQKAEGNPFFSEELVYALRDTGMIRVVDERCEIAPHVDLHAVAFPDTVQGVVASRIDRLAPTQQLTLKVASVIGRLFMYRVLRDMFPIENDKPQLPSELAVLAHLDFTSQETPEPELAYIFKHIIIQEASYSRLLFAQRRELHRLVAEWYERVFADDLSPYYALLAHHWGKAEVTAKAIAYLERAGGQALRDFANEEAVAFFVQALALADQNAATITPAQRAQWHLQIGEAYVNLSQYIEGTQHIEAGLALAGQPMPKTTASQIVSVLSQIARQALHRTLGLRTHAPSTQPREELLAMIRAYERFAEATFFLGKIPLCVYAVFRGINVAESIGASPELARSTAVVGASLGRIPLHRIATGYLDRALAIVETFDQLESHEYVSMVTSFYYSGVGNWAQVTARANHVRQIAIRLGDVRRWQDVVSHLVAMQYLQGDFAAGIALADELYAEAERRHDARFMALALQGKAFCELRTGAFDAAMISLQTVQRLIDTGDAVAVLSIKIEVLGELAELHLRRREYAAALHAAAQAFALTAKEIPSFYAAITGYTAPADLYLTLWENAYDLAAAGKLARSACQTLAKYARVFPIGQPAALIQQGRYAWLTGKPAQAHKAWHAGLARAQALDMRYEQGLAHYEIARHTAASNPARQEHQARAVDIFLRLNAAYDVARAQAL